MMGTTRNGNIGARLFGNIGASFPLFDRIFALRPLAPPSGDALSSPLFRSLFNYRESIHAPSPSPRIVRTDVLRFLGCRTFVLGPDQSAVVPLQQGQTAEPHQHRAGQAALRSSPETGARRQAQGNPRSLIYSFSARGNRSPRERSFPRDARSRPFDGGIRGLARTRSRFKSRAFSEIPAEFSPRSSRVRPFTDAR